MSKKEQNPLGIFTEAIGLYFSNFTKFIKYMTFPVLGQVAGLLIILTITYIYTKNMPPLIEKFSKLGDLKYLVTISILITLPGLAVFMKAFWEYLIAYGALNSMYENMQKSGRVYDFNAHTELIKRRAFPFIGLWTLFGIFTLIAVCPLFWVICGILAVYFVLSFQIFTFEPELTPIECIKKSLIIIKGHFASTFMLLALVGTLTYVFIPQIAIKLLDLCNITNFFTDLILPFVGQLQIPDFEQFGLKNPTAYDITLFFVEVTVAQILIQYTLPLRSILWSLWYKNLNQNFGEYTQTKKSSKKRPSEKLMEESHKKFGKKKLDRNIIRRASEKDDEI